jgi:hypothetical protein
VSVSLAGTPTFAETAGSDFGTGADAGSRSGGLDRVLLERNLERLLQERGSQVEESTTELGRSVTQWPHAGFSRSPTTLFANATFPPESPSGRNYKAMLLIKTADYFPILIF